jgi:hypothetical protein
MTHGDKLSRHTLSESRPMLQIYCGGPYLPAGAKSSEGYGYDTMLVAEAVQRYNAAPFWRLKDGVWKIGPVNDYLTLVYQTWHQSQALGFAPTAFDWQNPDQAILGHIKAALDKAKSDHV